MKSPSVSVVLATFNGEKYLRDQISSLFNQTLLPDEIIISDDNSTDRTRDIIAEMEKTAPVRVRSFHNKPGLGFRENFLRASTFAVGDWIAFCDQDDVWKETKLAECMVFSNNADVNVIVHQSGLIDSSGTRIGEFHQRISSTRVVPPLAYDVWGAFWGFSMVVRKSCLFAVEPDGRFVDYIDPNYKIAHDRWALFLGQTLGKTVEIATELADYRQHTHNLFGISKSKKESKLKDIAMRHRPYVVATRQMLEIVVSLPDETEVIFPAFDRRRAVGILSQAVRQAEARENIYSSFPPCGAAKAVWALFCGLYREPQNGNTRWRSFAKDFNICCKETLRNVFVYRLRTR